MAELETYTFTTQSGKKREIKGPPGQPEDARRALMRLMAAENSRGPTRAAAAEIPMTPSQEQRAEGASRAMTEIGPGTGRSRFGDFYDRVMNGITMGYGSELRGLDAAIMGETPEGEYFDYSRSFGERYNVAVGAEEEQRAAAQKRDPLTGFVTELGGAALTAGGLGKQGVTLLGRATTLPGKVGAGRWRGLSTVASTAPVRQSRGSGSRGLVAALWLARGLALPCCLLAGRGQKP